MIRPLLQVVDGIVNVTRRLAMKIASHSKKPSYMSQEPSKVHLKPLMGHIDALSQSIRQDSTSSVMTVVEIYSDFVKIQ